MRLARLASDEEQEYANAYRVLEQWLEGVTEAKSMDN